MASLPSLAQLNAAFSASVTQGCEALTVSFFDASTGSPTSWFWDFGNGETSSDQNPTVVYQTRGTYTVRLIVKNDTSQDYEEKDAYIKVFGTPAAGFTSDVSLGCYPLNVSFKDTTNLSGLNVKNWLWDFGDGNTSAAQKPSHIYTVAGSFNVSLRIETADGCVGTFTKLNAIKTGAKPTANFSATPLDGCASVLRQFTNLSGAGISSSTWSFGDKSPSSNEDSPEHHFRDTGWFSVRLIVSVNGCPDTILKKNYIHVMGPVARFTKTINCDQYLTVTFKNTSIADKTSQWDFGDGITIQNQDNVLYTYATPGNYNVKLTVGNNTACIDSVVQLVQFPAVNPVADYSPRQQSYCKGDTIQFMFTSYDSTQTNYFKWYFGNGDSTYYRVNYRKVNYVYDSNGIFNPVAFLRDINGCRDTLPLNPITVKGPTAEFTSSNTACSNKAVLFTDQSTPDGAPISTWLWSYGDGNIVQNQPPFSNTYAFPGLYNVNLKVTDGSGCTDTITHQIDIIATPVTIAQNDTLLCLGSSDTLTATGATTYSWWSDGGILCNPCSVPPVVSPTVDETYYVKGAVAGGCSSFDSAIITVKARQYVNVSFSDTSICAGNYIQLHASGTETYLWSPATGLSATRIPDPIAVPTVSTSYTVTGYSSNSCFADTATVNVNVNQPPMVDIPETIIQAPTGSTYQLQPTISADAQSWQWLPATGLSCYNCPNPVATIGEPITYTVTVYNENGCSSKDSVLIMPMCTEGLVFIPNTFTPNNDGMNDYFYPNSKVPLTVKYMLIYNRWGQKVFEKRNFLTNTASNGWDGRFNNSKQNTAVYVYMIQIECTDGSLINLKGNITLLR